MKLKIAIILTLLLYSLYAGTMYVKQATILFPAASAHHYPLERIPPGAALVEIPVSFGRARAVYWAPTDAKTPGPAIWFAHGNYETIENSFALVQPLVRHGIAILQFEYPGYGGADGVPQFDTIGEAADATWDWLAQRPEVDRTRMVAMGYSLGGGPASELTQHRDVRALILLSTHTSIADAAQHYALPSFLIRFPYDNVARIREFRGAVFVAHGRRDEVIPYAFGERLSKARPGIEFATEDCGHADCGFDQVLFAKRLPDWLAAQKILPPESGY
jgi:pimeloyl-ACP methyl ester carboxylesterase